MGSLCILLAAVCGVCALQSLVIITIMNVCITPVKLIYTMFWVNYYIIALIISSRSSQSGLITGNVPDTGSVNNHNCIASSLPKTLEPYVDIDSRPPAPLPPEVSCNMYVYMYMYMYLSCYRLTLTQGI